MLTALLSACSGDATGVSTGPFDLTIMASQVRMEYSPANDRWECTYTLTARGSGEGGTYGLWESGIQAFQFSEGGAENVPLDQSTLLEYWTLDRLYSGGVQRALRIAWGPEPFDIEYTFNLRSGTDATTFSRSVAVGCAN